MATATTDSDYYVYRSAVDQLYNGWTNYKTWNVALWMNNDQGFQTIAKQCENYAEFRDYLKTCNVVCTPDGVYFADEDIDAANINKNFWWLARQ
tara:strand:- start:199 stop:480 length:282 start_codon:yes stop_codon:yes gene_type:complete